MSKNPKSYNELYAEVSLLKYCITNLKEKAERCAAAQIPVEECANALKYGSVYETILSADCNTDGFILFGDGDDEYPTIVMKDGKRVERVKITKSHLEKSLLTRQWTLKMADDIKRNIQEGKCSCCGRLVGKYHVVNQYNLDMSTKTKAPISKEQIQKNKNEFEEIVSTYIHRDGISELMNWIRKQDFFEAPASTRFHEAYEGGLCEHSLTVFHKLEELNAIAPKEYTLSDESMAICALFHDLCKTGFYVRGTRNVKDEQTGQWTKAICYTIEDSFPYGHSEKSAFLIERFLRLTPLEAVCINAHMGFSDDRCKGNMSLMGSMFEHYPVALNLHLADLQATYQKV